MTPKDRSAPHPPYDASPAANGDERGT
ncbi:hypothetical protein SAMN05192548_10871, partial [Paraburkholderia terricola]